MPKLEDEIEAVLVTLDGPLSPDAIAHGWTVEAQDAMRKLLLDVKARIASSEPIPQLSLSRGLDHWGVVGGTLLEQMARLSVSLRERSKDTQHDAG